MNCVESTANVATCTTVGQDLYTLTKPASGSGTACTGQSALCSDGDGSIPALPTCDSLTCADNGNGIAGTNAGVGTTCAASPCTASECCTAVAEVTCTASFDCSGEAANNANTAASTVCATATCAALDCCEAPPPATAANGNPLTPCNDGDSSTPCDGDDDNTTLIIIVALVGILGVGGALGYQKMQQQSDGDGDGKKDLEDNPLHEDDIEAAKEDLQGKAEDKIEEKLKGTKKVMLSGRFDGGKHEQLLRDTGKLLKKEKGVEVLVVEAKAGGEGFGEQTMKNMKAMDVMVAFCFEDYGEKTKSKYCSYVEVKYAYEHDTPIIPLKVCLHNCLPPVELAPLKHAFCALLLTSCTKVIGHPHRKMTMTPAQLKTSSSSRKARSTRNCLARTKSQPSLRSSSSISSKRCSKQKPAAAEAQSLLDKVSMALQPSTYFFGVDKDTTFEVFFRVPLRVSTR